LFSAFVVEFPIIDVTKASKDKNVGHSCDGFGLKLLNREWMQNSSIAE